MAFSAVYEERELCLNAVLTTPAAIFKLAARRKLATGNPAADAERAFTGAT
jgi:hypothetical protein